MAQIFNWNTKFSLQHFWSEVISKKDCSCSQNKADLIRLLHFFFFYTGDIKVVIYLISLPKIALLEVFIRNLRLYHKTFWRLRKLRQEGASDITCNTYRFEWIPLFLRFSKYLKIPKSARKPSFLFTCKLWNPLSKIPEQFYQEDSEASAPWVQP